MIKKLLESVEINEIFDIKGQKMNKLSINNNKHLFLPIFLRYSSFIIIISGFKN